MRQISGTAAVLFLIATSAWSGPIHITGRIEPAGTAGARAELHSYPAARGAALATARPAADGSFSLAAPESGFYRVVVRADGMPEAELPLVPLVDETELPPMRLGEAGVRASRFLQWGPVQTAAPSVPAAPERTGLVLDAVTRKPIAGALVWQQFDGFFSWTRSAADGSFRLPAQDTRPLAAAASGYARAVRPEVPPDAPVSLALKPAVVLTGRVVDPDDRPVAGASVQVVPADPYPYYRGLRDLVTGFTREDGTFLLRGVPSRSMLQVGATADGFAPSAQMAHTGAPGSTPAPLRLDLGPGSSLTGRLVDADGRPVAGTEILLRDFAALDAGLAAVSREDRAVTDSSGRFRFEHLAGGLHRLSAGSTAAVLSEVDIPAQPSDRDLGNVRLAPAVAEIPMPQLDPRMLAVTSQMPALPEPPAGPGRPISGRITDPQEAPVAGADLLLHSTDAGRLFRVRSGADGSFQFTDVPDGSYQIAARAAGFADTRPEEVQVAGAPVSGLALRMEAGGSISGRILGLAEHELYRVQVTAWRDGVETLFPLRALADTEGRYRITGLPLGEWRITARRASSYLVERTVRLAKPGEDLSLDLTFPEGVALAGRVLLEDGKPLANALVSLGTAQMDRRQVRQTTTRSDGSFAISAVEPGTYRLLVFAQGVKHVSEVEIPQEGEMLILLGGGSSR